jgi:hypothetical protein
VNTIAELSGREPDPFAAGEDDRDRLRRGGRCRLSPGGGTAERSPRLIARFKGRGTNADDEEDGRIISGGNLFSPSVTR